MNLARRTDRGPSSATCKAPHPGRPSAPAHPRVSSPSWDRRRGRSAGPRRTDPVRDSVAEPTGSRSAGKPACPLGNAGLALWKATVFDSVGERYAGAEELRDLVRRRSEARKTPVGQRSACPGSRERPNRARCGCPPRLGVGDPTRWVRGRLLGVDSPSDSYRGTVARILGPINRLPETFA